MATGSSSGQPEGGFAFDDAYSSDGSELGLLTAHRQRGWLQPGSL